jgi:hypothetical protein
LSSTIVIGALFIFIGMIAVGNSSLNLLIRAQYNSTIIGKVYNFLKLVFGFILFILGIILILIEIINKLL